MGLAMWYEPYSTNVREEEREQLLDIFSTCETCLREEVSLANQMFDDLGRYCPNDLETCEPIQMGRLQEDGANARFVSLLGALGVDTPQKLCKATGVNLAICSDVLSNPLRCDGKGRARVLEALENPPICAWDIADAFTGEPVGKELAIWMRKYFKTPWQFSRQAAECELKCYLIGVVGQLTDTDLESLLYAPSLFHAVANAAGAARTQRERDTQAAVTISNAINSLSDAKRNLEEAAACVVPKAHN